MSVAVAHRTVRLWPAGASPLRSVPPDRSEKPTSGDPDAADQTSEDQTSEDQTSDAVASEMLAAITSTYRRGRAGIIAGDLPPTHSPTVPLGLLPTRASTQVVAHVVGQVVADGLAADPDDGTPTFWSRLVRSRRPAPRGRHSPRS